MRSPKILLLFGLLLLAVPWGQAAAQSASPRGALHDGYGRMVFDWDGPVNYSADVVNGELVLRFGRPVRGEFRNLLRPLSHYLRSVSVSADRTMATFPLARPVQAKAFAGNNNSVVVDLVEAQDGGSGAAAPPDESQAAAATPAAAAGGPDSPVSLLPPSPQASPQAAQPAPPARTAPPAHAPVAAAAEPPAVEVRAGEHGTYNRLVFDWPKAVDYKVEQHSGKATITFARSGRIDMQGLQSTLPPDVTVLSSETGAKATTVAFAVPPTARLRHFASGNKVVVDVVRAANAAPPTGSATTPLAPPPGGDVALPALQPLAPQEKPKLPSEALAAATAATGPSPLKPIPDPKSKAKVGPVVAPPAPTPAVPTAASAQAPAKPTPALPSAAPAAPAQPAKVFSLSVAWDKPVAAAVFQRAGYLWIVFDRHQEVDATLLRRLGGEAVVSVVQFPNKEATVLRLVVQPDYEPSVRRDGLLWVIDLMNQPPEPKEAINVTAPASLPTGEGIMLGVNDAGNVVSVPDPEIGDSMLVVPVIPLGAGVYPGRDTPDVELLPTEQGVAIVPHVDGLDVRSSRGGVTIGMPGGKGLRLSQPSGHMTVADKTGPGAGFFDVAAWKRGGEENFQAERRIVEAGLVDLPPSRRSAAHMQAARFFFANGYAAEALGYLRMAATDEPTLVDTGTFRALRGASQVLMQHWDLAQADLDNPLLKDDVESQFWRAAARAGVSESPADQDKALALGLPLLKEYPHALKWPLAALATRAALAAADDDAAQQALGILDREAPTKVESGQLDYLHGAYDEMAGQFDKAVDEYDSALAGDNREYRARAGLASAELQLKLHRIKPREAAEMLDRLRFAWREENFEFGLLRRYAELELEDGSYADALRALRSLANNYPDNKGAPNVAKMMNDSFAKLYQEGAADALPPVSAIGLYDEFRELTPTGPKGDEMIRKLADRLASVDLLDRAAELLKHQVTYRLQGLDRARVGAQLALLELLNRQPQAAVDALQISDTAGLPAELQQQRNHLKARALADVDRVPEAIQLLTGDNSSEAALLRAEIHWRKQNWEAAAAAFETLVPRPADRNGPLDDASAKLVISWATALALGNDERGLATLRRNFGPSMAGTPYKDGFLLLTSALDRDIPDMPAVSAKIKEAEGFQSFMSNYKKRIQASGLSGIN